MGNNERYPLPESNIPKHPYGWTQVDECAFGDRFTKRKPSDWLSAGGIDTELAREIFPAGESFLDEEMAVIEDRDAFFSQYPELAPKRKQ